MGNKAYENNQFNEAITLFKKAPEIVKIPSFYLSLGNSYFVTGDFRSAMKTYQITAYQRRVFYCYVYITDWNLYLFLYSYHISYGRFGISLIQNMKTLILKASFCDIQVIFFCYL